MFIQFLIGFFLSLNYFSISNDIFYNSFIIFFNLNYGWILRFFHRNITSIIFILIFIHIFRRIIYKNFNKNENIWKSGILIILILIIISFIGYSLIINQISYWARIVITNFLAIIPIIGNELILLIWGNKFIDNILLNRFFSLHFILAILILFISLIHLIILHINKSSNPLRINNNIDQINLNPLLIFKDIIIFIILMFLFFLNNILFPVKLNNPDNFNQIIIFKTPSHIEPEWYFLFFYSILRSNENKLNGLILIIYSILILLDLPHYNKSKFISNKYFLINKIIILILILIIMLIVFIGTKISKEPYIFIVKILINLYFYLILIIFFINKINNVQL